LRLSLPLLRRRPILDIEARGSASQRHREVARLNDARRSTRAFRWIDAVRRRFVKVKTDQRCAKKRENEANENFRIEPKDRIQRGVPFDLICWISHLTRK
jgi:hypothetical protein